MECIKHEGRGFRLSSGNAAPTTPDGRISGKALAVGAVVTVFTSILSGWALYHTTGKSKEPSTPQGVTVYSFGPELKKVILNPEWEEKILDSIPLKRLEAAIKKRRSDTSQDNPSV